MKSENENGKTKKLKVLIHTWHGKITDNFRETSERYVSIVDDELNTQIRYELKIVDGKLECKEVA